MKFPRSSALFGALAVSALTLAACGSDDNTAASGIAPNHAIACAGAKALKASGSSAQANAMTHFTNAYQINCPGRRLDYTSSGSGAGVKEFVGGQTDFGGSDSPLSAGEAQQAQQRCHSPAWNLPLVFGPIAVTYHLDTVHDLTLDGPALGKIFSGQITRWDDPALRALNPGATLPPAAIDVIYRSDESGTTDNFQQYLAAASAGTWTKGAGKSFVGGIGEGVKGNEGNSAAVKSTPNSITFNEWSFALKQRLDTARIITSAGPDPVSLTVDSASKAVDAVKIKGQGNDLVLDTGSFYRPTTQGAYPIVLSTYELVCSKYPQSDIGPAVRAFLHSAMSNGQIALAGAGYVPIPASFTQRLSQAVDTIG